MLIPQFVNGPVEIAIGERNVFKTAACRIVAADRRPIDTKRGIDRRFDVLGADVAVAGPTEFARFGAAVVGDADCAAASDARTGPERGLLHEVIAPGLCVGRADRPAELAHRQNQRTVEQAIGLQIGDERAERGVELAAALSAFRSCWRGRPAANGLAV